LIRYPIKPPTTFARERLGTKDIKGTFLLELKKEDVFSPQVGKGHTGGGGG
jgi:hypothetical protein